MDEPSPKKNRPKKRLLNIRDVGLMLGIKDRTVRKLVELGHLRKPRRVAGSPRWFVIDVKVYLARLRSGEFDDCKIEQKPASEGKNRQRTAKPGTTSEQP